MRDVAGRDLSTIRVTPEARRAIAQVTELFGKVMFHVTLGCCDARSPLCLEAGDLRLGARDVLIGFADGAPVYEMVLGDDEPQLRDYILDVMPGTSVGFSLEAGLGLRFTLGEARSALNFWTAAAAAIGDEP